MRIRPLNSPHTQRSADGGAENPFSALTEMDDPRPGKMEHGAPRTETCLKLVGAEGFCRREAAAEEDRDGDESASAGNGIDETGDKGGEKENAQQGVQ